MKHTFLILLLAVSSVLFAGCATIPNGGIYGEIGNSGKVAPVIDTVQVGEGMLVETVTLDADTEVNIQINEDETSDPLLWDNVLTIGKFSTLLGSGFTSDENIYYEKRIHSAGKDLFSVNGKTYLVTWKCNYKDARTYLVSDHFSVSVSEFSPRPVAPPPAPSPAAPPKK